MNIDFLDALDIIEYHNHEQRTTWITAVSDRDLYKIATWLLMNLKPETNQLIHKRSNMRDILTQFYETNSWSQRQRWFIGNSVIDLWPDRRLDNDPRYQY